MAKKSEFEKALHNFTMDMACGDAIRALTDRGYAPQQIKDTLTFPAPISHIAQVMWDRLVATRKILLSDPYSLISSGNPGENGAGSEGIPADDFEIIERRDEYGRKSFLRIKKESSEESIFSPEDYVRYETVWVIKSALEQVSLLSDHIPLKVRNTGSHQDK